MRQQEGGGIWIVGGGWLVKELLAAHLMDEMWVQIAPVMLGHGKRLFEPGDYAQRLTTVGITKMGELVEMHFKC
nr:dihydrofolate reductase family protein [Secundilactobacillus folii]